MKLAMSILLCALFLAACGKGNDSKPMMQKEHDTLEKAKNVNNMLLQQAEKQKQEAEKQTQ